MHGGHPAPETSFCGTKGDDAEWTLCAWVGLVGGREALTWLPSTVLASLPLELVALQETGPALGQEAQGSACAIVPDGVAQLWLSSQGHCLPGVGVMMG